MITSIDHFDRYIRYAQSTCNAREIVCGAAVTWKPSSDPAELVRRFRFLESLVGDLAGDDRFKAARSYCAGLEVEIAMGESA